MDEALVEKVMMAINKAAGLPDDDILAWNDHARAAIQVMIDEGWGPNEKRPAPVLPGGPVSNREASNRVGTVKNR